MFALGIFSIFIGTFSGIVGVVISIMALILVTAVGGQHLVLLHSADAFLFAVVAAQLLYRSRLSRLVMFLSSTLLALSLQRCVLGACTISRRSTIHFAAKVNGSRTDRFSWQPFCACSLFIERGSDRLLCATLMPHQRLTKRSSQPLAGPMDSFHMTSTFNSVAKLAPASGG